MSNERNPLARRLLLAASLAAIVAAVPVTFGFGKDGSLLKMVSAMAKDGGDGGGDGGSDDGGGDDNGGDRSGSDDGDGDDNGGDRDGSDDGPGDDNGGDRDNDDDNDDNDDADDAAEDAADDAEDAAEEAAEKAKDAAEEAAEEAKEAQTREHVDPVSGAKVEVSPNSVEIVHPNGLKEELENGVYEMKDATGRTVVERQATQEDIDRVMSFTR
jgi:hypothetical protein